MQYYIITYECQFYLIQSVRNISIYLDFSDDNYKFKGWCTFFEHQCMSNDNCYQYYYLTNFTYKRQQKLFYIIILFLELNKISQKWV